MRFDLFEMIIVPMFLALVSLKYFRIHAISFKNPRCFARKSQVGLLMSKANDENSIKKFTKSNLPSKICTICGRSFQWRKKWSKVYKATILPLSGW